MMYDIKKLKKFPTSQAASHLRSRALARVQKSGRRDFDVLTSDQIRESFVFVFVFAGVQKSARNDVVTSEEMAGDRQVIYLCFRPLFT